MKKYETVIGHHGGHELSHVEDLIEIQDLLKYEGIEVSLSDANKLWRLFSSEEYSMSFADFITYKDNFIGWCLDE